jgi:hypothetical protein
MPIKGLHVGRLEPKVRALVGPENVFVHDYWDVFDWASSPVWGGD